MKSPFWHDGWGYEQLRLAEAMKVPPPSRLGWTAAVVAVYVPNAFNFPTDQWGVVQDRRSCQYSLHELLANAFLLIQNLRRTDFTGGDTYHR